MGPNPWSHEESDMTERLTHSSPEKEVRCPRIIADNLAAVGLGVGKVPWRREWQPTPVFLPGESYGERNLAGYSPWGDKEWYVTE